MQYPDRTVITDIQPEFGWIMDSKQQNDLQLAYQILVASSLESLDKNVANMWDTGKVESNNSLNIEYSGSVLLSHSNYYWKVRIWDKDETVSPYSDPQMFRTGELTGGYNTDRYPLEQREIIPVTFIKKKAGHYFIDFGRAAFGTIQVTLKSNGIKHQVEVLLGEKLKSADEVDDNPGGSIRYREMVLQLKQGTHTYVVPITPNERNTRENAIKMPDYTGEVMPFRYCEIINSPSELTASDVKQIVVHYPFNDEASKFTCSDTVLNDVWNLCKYTIKATSFCGVYVDGDRERIPYEADAYINQLCHYNVDSEYTMGRYSHEYLIRHPTWPTEWILHSVLMAWADYLYTGNKESMAYYYDDLKAKTLLALAREDGLISTRTGLVSDEVLHAIHFKGELRDIVDWPPASFTKRDKGERDGYVFTDINTVVNAFHYQALHLMSKIADALDKTEDAHLFNTHADVVRRSINKKLFDYQRGIYVDGEGTNHSSLHANMIPLAFGIVPEEYRNTVTSFIKSRGMVCSVYGAQYLLEALYAAGEDEYALYLMTNSSDRSWPHMIYNVGTTITLEAWDKKYKENLDWNHAWGAAPANIIPRYVMGIQPLEPGFAKILIKPQVGTLKFGSMDLPTVRGKIHIDFEYEQNSLFLMNIDIPANTTAKVYLPALKSNSPTVEMDDLDYDGMIIGKYIMLDDIGSGTHKFVKRIN
jgi:hypothetical protein